jgi:PBP1b-binding outer membrane lipoprotein LpoB
MKKIISAAAVSVLLIMFLTGCAQGTTAVITDTAVTPASQNSTGDTFQTGLPLRVTAPADASTINGDSVTVQGKTAPGAAVNINNNAGIADADGNFSITITLEEGPNAIDVIATDENSKQGEVLLMVNAASGS